MLDQYDRGVWRPTNGVKIVRRVLPQAGDGTVKKSITTKALAPAIGLIGFSAARSALVGLKHNVIQAYDDPSQNYEAGDEIWLFGFSRRGYTVRRVVGQLTTMVSEARDSKLSSDVQLACHAIAVDEQRRLFQPTPQMPNDAAKGQVLEPCAVAAYRAGVAQPAVRQGSSATSMRGSICSSS
jgi:Uncharacterized alpha/beta hydrolase domain (DUF2235)